MPTRRKRRLGWLVFPVLIALLLLAVPAGSVYYAAAGGKACIRCHELEPAYHQWAASTHRSVQCKECHGSIFSTDVGFHLNNIRQLWRHLRGQVPERLLLRQSDIRRGMNERCGHCHQQEFAAWAAGPHHATYERIFLNADHNTARLLNDQCLLCHGMYFERSIRELVQPLDRRGPWRLATDSVPPQEASIPCLACHEMHRPGTPLALRSKVSVASIQSAPASTGVSAKSDGGTVGQPDGGRPQSASHLAGLQQRIEAGSAADPPAPPPAAAAFYDRREQMHFRAELLPVPAMLDGNRPVSVSPDARQAICYQCHAADHTFQVGSGDDRTCVGVHEGLSCLACHAGHDLDARASCAQCHPRLSNCGLDVGKMDTTFIATASRHNIHFVKCADCHTKGIPARTKLPAPPIPITPSSP